MISLIIGYGTVNNACQDFFAIAIYLRALLKACPAHFNARLQHDETSRQSSLLHLIMTLTLFLRP